MKNDASTDLETIITTTLTEEDSRLTERGFVEIDFVSRKKIQSLNQIHRQKNIPTDVLSFPLYHRTELKSAFNSNNEPLLLGSLVLCKAVIRTRAKEEGMGYNERLTWTLKHGLKHLLGYNHNPDGSSWFPIQT